MNGKGALLWIIVIAVSCFLLGSLAGRFCRQDGGETEKTYVERLESDLDLTDDQKQGITDHLTKEDEAIRLVLDRYREPAAREIEKIRDDTRKGIRDLLSPAQCKLFDGDS